MAGLNIKKNDTVEVLSGKDRGKRGRVIEVLPKASRVRVEGIVEREDPIHVSNVALIDPKSDKPTRVGSKFLADGTRIRIAKRSGMSLDK
jgi:large subunit ribosomal protein L24